MKRDPEFLAHAWYEAWGEGDVERVRTLLAPSFVHTSPFGRLEGRDHYLEVVEPMSRDSVVRLTVHEMVLGDGIAVVRFTNETRNGSVESCDWIRVRDGFITEVRSFYDSGSIKEQLEIDSYS